MTKIDQIKVKIEFGKNLCNILEHIEYFITLVTYYIKSNLLYLNYKIDFNFTTTLIDFHFLLAIDYLNTKFFQIKYCKHANQVTHN